MKNISGYIILLVGIVWIGAVSCRNPLNNATDGPDTGGPDEEDVPDTVETELVLQVTSGTNCNMLEWNSIDEAIEYNLYWSNDPGVTKHDMRVAQVESPFVHSKVTDSIDPYNPWQYLGLRNSCAYYYILEAKDSTGKELCTSKEVLGIPKNYSTVRWANAPTYSGAAGDAYFLDVCCDGEGNTYVVGAISGNCRVDFGNSVVVECVGRSYAVLLKMSESGVAQWARTAIGNNVHAFYNCVCVDADGSIYVGGEVNCSGTYDFGSGVVVQSPSPNYGILAKYDAHGTPVWARTVSPDSIGRASFDDIAVDREHNVVTAGTLRNQYLSVCFNLGNGTVFACSSAYGRYGLLAKYSSTGTVLFAIATPELLSSSVACDGNGNCYVAGKALTADPYGYMTLRKYNSAGGYIWGRAVAQESGSSGYYGVTVDASGNVYAVGCVGKGKTYFSDEVMVELHELNPNSGAAIVKYSEDGEPLWAKSVLPTGSFIPSSFFQSVAVDSNGDVIACGQTDSGQLGFDEDIAVTGYCKNCTGVGSSILVKYSSTGEVIWAQSEVDKGSYGFSSRLSAVATYCSTIYAAGFVHAFESSWVLYGGNLKVTFSKYGLNPVILGIDS